MGKLSKLQAVELEILKAFARICEAEGLTWYAMLGTLLGAVRHGGFIPWDEDIDVVMPRSDYDRLRSRPDLFAEPYFLQTPQNDPGAAPRFMRLRRSDTTVMKGFPNRMTRGGHLGAYIDILPLDFVPDARAARRLHRAAMRINQQMLACAALDECETGEPIPDKLAQCYEWGGIKGCYSLIAERYERMCARYPEGPYCSIPVTLGLRGCRIYDAKWFSAREQMNFEDIKVFVPSGWREALAASYPEGLDMPKEDDRDPYKGMIIVDTDNPYTKYLYRFTEMLKDIGGKRVLLFGAGDSLRIWMERYSQGLDIVCTFDNAKAKWGTTAYGVPVRPPHELPGLLDGNSRLIVASIWRAEISKQLEDMGISDYYLFMDGWDYRPA